MLAAVLPVCLLHAQTAPRITTPKEALGFNIGDDYQVANYTQLEAYWKKLAAESDRMKLVDIGTTAEGRRQYMAIISSPANIRNLDRYREIARKLALAEGVSEPQAHELAREGKAVVWIDGGLHASESVGSQQLMEMVYQMVSRTDPETMRLLDDCIQLYVQANPDGQEFIANWYMRGSENPDAPLKPAAQRSLNNLPRLYNKYVGHDDNRDFYMSNMPETTNMNRVMFLEWFPQIVYNHHQTGPAGAVIFMPPFRDPFNYNFDPLIPLGVEMVGTALHTRLVAEGKGGSAMRSGANYSTWWNGGLRTVGYFHNMIGILTEIIGNPTPTTIPLVAEKQLPQGDWPMPIAPQEWHYRQSIEYEITNNRAILDLASRYRETFLFNIWRMGENSIEKGSRDNWTVTPKRIAALEAAGGEAGRRPRRSRQCGAGGFACQRGGQCASCCRSQPRSSPRPHRGRPQRPHPPLRSLQHRPPRSQAARPPRLHPAFRPARFRHRHRVRQRPAQERHHRSQGHGSLRRQWQELSRRLLRGEDRAGLPPAHHGHVRAAGPPQRFPLSRRAAHSPLRHHRLDPGLPDGRGIRPRSRRLRRPLRQNFGPASPAARLRHRRIRSRRLLDQPPHQQLLQTGELAA